MTLLGLVGSIPDWVDQAACGALTSPGINPEAFFPPKGKNNEDDTRDARAVCTRCPVREACAAYALEHNIQDGIWGGLTDRSRRRIQTRGRGRHYSGPPRNCRRCGEPIPTPRGDFCGQTCRDAHNREYSRNYQRQRTTA